MKERCNVPTQEAYADYGGRGIAVCKEWDESFEAWFAYMGPRPSPDHSIDRINNDGNYEPGNVRWATREQQQRNTSQNRLLTHDGLTLCVVEWAERVGLPCSVLSDRINKLGWPVAKALLTPKRYTGS
jgi:hypothetical protein